MNSPESSSNIPPIEPEKTSPIVKRERLSLTLNTASQLVLEQLEIEKPESFNPKWVKERLPNVYAYFTRSMRSGLIKDWNDFTSQLPENWKAAWTKENQEKWDFEKAKTRLIELLEIEKPEQFNKKWIIDHDAKLYRYLNYLSGYKATMYIWKDIIDSLGDWKTKWKDGFLEKNIQGRTEASRKYTLDSITKDLSDLLAKENPSEWSPTYIAKKARYIFRFVENNLKDDKGNLQWEKLVSRLPKEYQAKWKRKTFFDDITLPKEYSDQSEVNNVLKKNRETMYLLYESRGPDEEMLVNNICIDFIDLIRKGNIEAKSTFIKHLQPIISKWLSSGALSVSLAQDPEAVKIRMERCLYLWNKEKPFLAYLFKSLHLTARGMKKYTTNSLDENRPGKERNYHEIIGEDDVSD